MYKIIKAMPVPYADLCKKISKRRRDSRWSREDNWQMLIANALDEGKTVVDTSNDDDSAYEFTCQLGTFIGKQWTNKQNHCCSAKTN